MARLQSKGRRGVRARPRCTVDHGCRRGFRVDPACRAGPRGRSAARRALVDPCPGVHDLRQVVAHSRTRSLAHRSGREPPDDLGHRGVPGRSGQAGRLRRRTLLRWVRRGRPVCSRYDTGGGECWCRGRCPLRHERRHSPLGHRAANRRRRRRRGGARRHSFARRCWLLGRQRSGGGEGGGQASAGHDQRLRGALRQRQSVLDHPDAGAQARPPLPP